MATISIKKDMYCNKFEGDEYIIDTNRKFGGCEVGDLICCIHPFFSVPLRLEIAIRRDGQIVFRSWNWDTKENGYLHTYEKPENLCESFEIPFKATQEQTDTVNGLFSGRIRFEGLELPVGASVQAVCPIDVKREEELLGRRIYLS